MTLVSSWFCSTLEVKVCLKTLWAFLTHPHTWVMFHKFELALLASPNLYMPWPPEGKLGPCEIKCGKGAMRHSLLSEYLLSLSSRAKKMLSASDNGKASPDTPASKICSPHVTTFVNPSPTAEGAMGYMEKSCKSEHFVDEHTHTFLFVNVPYCN